MSLSYHVGNLSSRGWKKEEEHQNKKKEIAGKMPKIELGKKAKRDFGYVVEDHKGRVLSSGGSKKGIESLSIPKRDKGAKMNNIVGEGKNEENNA